MIRSSFVFFVLFLFLFSCERERDECPGIGPKGVSIKVVNKSGKRVEKMILIAPQRFTQREMDKAIENNGQTCITYKSDGESSFQLLFIMENGDTIQSQEGYAEGGYTFTDTIRKDHVTSSLNHDAY